MKLILITSILLTLSACSPETQIIKEKEYIYVYQPLADTLQASVTDSVVSGLKANGADTLYIVKYFPKEKIITVDGRADTIRINTIDTIYQTKTIVEETPFMSKLGYMFLGIAVLVTILLIIKWLK